MHCTYNRYYCFFVNWIVPDLGARCQVNENDCASMPCSNGGLCIDKVNGFYCNCTEDWMGTICEVPYDICQMKPCLNNGTCTTGMNKHEFSCSCLPGTVKF